MPLIYNGTEIKKVIYNGVELNEVIYNKIKVFEIEKPTSDEYFTFTLLKDNTYSIATKDINNMPAKVILPSTHNNLPITTIGNYAFDGCSSLTSVTIPNSVTTIGIGTFRGCSKLTSITIPASVTFIGNDAFSGCSKLTSIIIPDSVASINAWTFSSCSSLTSITIGNGVASIGSYAFSRCSSLKKITCNAITPPVIEPSTFNNSPEGCPIYVPAESVDAYKAANYWKDRADYIQAIPN